MIPSLQYSKLTEFKIPPKTFTRKIVPYTHDPNSYAIRQKWKIYSYLVQIKKKKKICTFSKIILKISWHIQKFCTPQWVALLSYLCSLMTNMALSVFMMEKEKKFANNMVQLERIRTYQPYISTYFFWLSFGFSDLHL